MVSILINSLAGGGAEKVVLTLLKEFKQAGVPVELVLLEKERFYDLPEGVNVHYLTEFDSIKNPFRKFMFVFISAMRLKKYVKEKDVKVVQSHLIRSNYINVLAQLFGGKHKTQIVNHMMVSFDKKRGFLGKANLWLYKQLYAKADMIVSISRVMKNDLDDFFRLKNKERHMVIYNPHDVDFIKERAKEEPEVFEFDPSKKYLVSVGRLVERKRVDITIKALAKVRETYPNTELLVLGSGEEMDHYKKVTNDLKLNPYVHFLGFISNPFSYLARADVFVLSSTDEGLPNIIIESMICGTAVVSSDCKSGPRETLNPESDIQKVLKDEIEVGEFGVLFPVKDEERLADALLYMLENDDARDEFVQKGLQRAEDFRSSKVAQTYIKTFGLDTPQTIESF
ncbi:MAG: glycosyltransferase [Bacteroidia bacterium]|nr:glycosyltransferase [Bacteroidia bacterium]